MTKDVIYIDTEDDITAIIGNVKSASAKVVALVPPKRPGVLQSAVNLKLLQKAATSAGRHIVLITNEQSLISLAAGVKIPVAKNLQSRPEVPTIDALQIDDSDVINGEELPVGEIAEAAGALQKPVDVPPSTADKLSDKVDLQAIPPQSSTRNPLKTPKKGGIKIPNFDIFRKRFFLIGAGIILLLLVLIWAFVIAPSVAVTITAKTTAVPVDRTLSLESGLPASKPAELKLKPDMQQIKKSNAIDFDATGTKDIGEKASGKVNLSNSFDSDAVTVPAGTVFTATSGQKFTSSTGVTVPGARVASGGIQPGSASVTIVASALGPEYNLAGQSYSVQGFGNLGASGEQMAGGTREKVTVVSDDDVTKAKEKLAQQDTQTIKDDLRKQFKGDFVIIDESFVAEVAAPAVAPRVGEQAKRAKLTLETTYSLVGIARADIKTVLNDVLKDVLDNQPNQSIYSSGDNNLRFQDFQRPAAGVFKAQVITTGYIGATIDTKKLAEDLKGKRYGEIEQKINQIAGVNKVDIQFSPFWVTAAPQDVNKITIRFTVVNDGR